MLVAHVCLRNFSTFTVNLLKFNNSDVSTMLLFAAHICTVQLGCPNFASKKVSLQSETK